MTHRPDLQNIEDVVDGFEGSRYDEAPDDDLPIPEDPAIQSAHPTRTGRHDLYAEAMRLVGAKHSKAALVELVNWLLWRIDEEKEWTR